MSQPSSVKYNRLRRVPLKALSAVALAALTFTGCSGGDQESGRPVNTGEVVIDEKIQEALDVAPGEAVELGSIESVRQDLGKECSELVAPLRELMDQYPSLLQVPPGLYDEPFAKARECEKVDPQQWYDFYNKEVAGWVYAKPQE